MRSESATLMHNVLRGSDAKRKEMAAWLATQQGGDIYGKILRRKEGIRV